MHVGSQCAPEVQKGDFIMMQEKKKATKHILLIFCKPEVMIEISVLL